MGSTTTTTEPLLSSSPPPYSHAIQIKTPRYHPSSTLFNSSLTPLPENSELPSSPYTPSSFYPSSPALKDQIIFGSPPCSRAFPPPAPTPSSDDDGTGTYPTLSPAPFSDDTSVINNNNTNTNNSFYEGKFFPLSPHTPHSPSPAAAAAADDSNPFSSSKRKGNSHLHRSQTAPCMAPITNLPPSEQGTKTGRADTPKGISVVRNAIIYLTCYLFFGVIVYSIAPDDFSSASDSTHPFVDALYFCIVTMCTIGYGDITPLTPAAKIFSILFVIIGFGFVDILLSGMVSFVLDLQESLLLTAVQKPDDSHRHDLARRYIVDVKKGRMRIRLKVAVALCVVILCVGIGAVFLCFIENLNGLDALYLSVMSVTTVGYGDQAFKTMGGRLFASIWLLVSTLTVARAFLYLAEMRIEKRHRKIAKLVLSRDMTYSEFLEADTDHNGLVTKSDFVVYKLKEMGKISELDVRLICQQFERLDESKCGKITLSALIDSHHLDTSRGPLGYNKPNKA